MSETLFLFPRTISSIQSRLHELSEKFRNREGHSLTGGNSRLLNPERVSMFEEIGALERLLSCAKELNLPDQIVVAEIGHQISVSDQHGKQFIFHICSELDVKYFNDKVQFNDKKIPGRLLSVDSALGKLFFGKKLGEKVQLDGQKFDINKIEISKYL